MRRTLLFIFSLFLVSSLCINAQMKLQLSQEIIGEQPASFTNNNLESNLNLELPPEVTAPGGIKDFVKGMILLGILADVSIPFGEAKSVDELEGSDLEPGFKHIAGTGFSGHIVASYVVSTAVLLSFRAGYISFGKQTQEGEDEFGQTYKYENCYSQIPILLGAYYLIATGSGFKPYVGLALGAFIQRYEYTGTRTYEYEYDNMAGVQQQYEETETADVSSTGFGIVPAVGFYYMLGSVMLHASFEYSYLFSKLEVTGDDYEFSDLEKGLGFAGINQEVEYKESYNVNYLSVLLGVSFPLGGN